MAFQSEELESQENYKTGDYENFGYQKDAGFSHQSLVMFCMRKALENAGKEMMPGWFQIKYDRMGNAIKTYNQDTREVFISSVEACLIAMECDLDSDAKNQISKILEKVENKKIEMLNAEEEEWNKLIPIMKRNLLAAGRGFIRGYLNKDKLFYQSFIEDKVKYYREIMKSLTNQTERINFYQQEIYGEGIEDSDAYIDGDDINENNTPSSV